MISSKDSQPNSPIFAPKRVKDLLNFPEDGFKKLKIKTENQADNELMWTVGQIVRDGLTGEISTTRVFGISRVVEKIILEKKQLTKEAKYLIDLMLVFSLNNRSEFLKTNKEHLLMILNLLKNDDKDFDWFYKKVTSYLSESQLTKLQEAYSESHSKNKEIDFKSKRKVLVGIINLFNGRNSNKILVKKDSTSFLGLDNSAKEAACWRELELSRSGNNDFARLAGVIAWKNYLFKEPLLKEFCLKNGHEYNSLGFVQKANLTKQAINHFSAKERARILDEAIEAELNKRKKTLETETDPKFINKRVSMGIELEMSGLSFELAIIYAWYENLDRSLVDDSMAFNKEIEKLFKQLLQFKDQEEAINKLKSKSLKIDEIIGKFKDDLSEEEQADLKRQTILIVAEFPDRDLKRQLSLWLKNNPLNLDILELIQKFWKNKLNAAAASFSESREIFRSSLTKVTKKDEHKYTVQAGFANNLPPDYPDIANKLMDIFKHHMGQAQALGHNLGKDAYGEYSLAYTSGNYKDPYRVNLRETWELAKTAFHNLDVKSRPMHVTIGWKEDVEKRGISISASLSYQESSLMNFVLLSTGWANRGFITDFRKKNETKLADEGKTAVINSYSDSGKAEFIINRSSGYLYGVEFRGLSPAPGHDQARLFSALGSLGTAMKAYMIVESDKSGEKIDVVDQELHEIWAKFRAKVKIIHENSGAFPDLFNAKAWHTSSYSEPLTNFFLKMAEDLDKDEGLASDMRKLVQETIGEIEQVFNKVPDKIPDKKSNGILSGLFSKIGFKK